MLSCVSRSFAPFVFQTALHNHSPGQEVGLKKDGRCSTIVTRVATKGFRDLCVVSWISWLKYFDCAQYKGSWVMQMHREEVR
jgi:hypothetical protein